MPLAAAYGHALEQYEGESFGAESRATSRRRCGCTGCCGTARPSCHANCSGPARRPPPRPGPRAPPGPTAAKSGARELRLFGHVLERAACLHGAASVPCPPSRCPIRRASCCATSRAACPTSTCTMLSSRCAPAAGRVAKSAALYSAARPPIPRARSGWRTPALLTRSVPTLQANRLEKAVAAAYTFLQRGQAWRAHRQVSQLLSRTTGRRRRTSHRLGGPAMRWDVGRRTRPDVTP